MIQNIESIPVKQAKMIVVPKERPTVVGYPNNPVITYGNFTLPWQFANRFLRKCGIKDTSLTDNEVEEKVHRANNKKDIYLRFAENRPISVVTSKFKEMKPENVIDETSRLVKSNPVIRYFKNDESLQINFPLNTRFEGMHLVVETGKYGVYGGSGFNALRYGIGWYNSTCTNWTIFLDKVLKRNIVRIIHQGNINLEEKISDILSVTQDVEARIGESKEKSFTREELDNYLAIYEKKGINKGITEQIRKESPDGISAYDLSYRLTQLCQKDKISDVTRGRIEYLAGEVVMCYDSIKSEINRQTIN